MTLKILVLLASVAQVVGAIFLSIGTFEQSERLLPVFIQPVGWAFSIWGLIYALSFVYAVYQLIPKYDTPLLSATRLPAFSGFMGSIAWLFFAGQTNWTVWLTIPILFFMAFILIRVVNANGAHSTWATLFSRDILLPYAAWTAIAAWVNVQALLLDQAVVTTATLNYLTNAVLFAGLALFTFTHFRNSHYSPWYGGVMIWAGSAVVVANVTSGSLWFAIVAGIYTFASATLVLLRMAK